MSDITETVQTQNIWKYKYNSIGIYTCKNDVHILTVATFAESMCLNDRAVKEIERIKSIDCKEYKSVEGFITEMTVICGSTETDLPDDQLPKTGDDDDKDDETKPGDKNDT